MSPKILRLAQWAASTRAGGRLGTAVAGLAGARPPRIAWRVTEGPWFVNMIACLEFDGRTARLRYDLGPTPPVPVSRARVPAAEAQLSPPEIMEGSPP